MTGQTAPRGEVTVAVSRVLRASMLAAARRFHAPEGTALREALDDLVDALDQWVDVASNGSGKDSGSLPENSGDWHASPVGPGRQVAP